MAQTTFVKNIVQTLQKVNKKLQRHLDDFSQHLKNSIISKKIYSFSSENEPGKEYLTKTY